MKIVTIFDGSTVLSKMADEISLAAGLEQVQSISKQLIETLKPLMPAAGLAAPQIGISKRIFIFSWNRSEDTLETVINPKILTQSDESSNSWEACFSTMQEDGESQAALVNRPIVIDVEYLTLTGKIVQKRLTGFSARVFLHEYDHLNGVENVRKEGAEIKSFSNKASLVEFMQGVKSRDSVNYQEPIPLR